MQLVQFRLTIGHGNLPFPYRPEWTRLGLFGTYETKVPLEVVTGNKDSSQREYSNFPQRHLS